MTNLRDYFSNQQEKSATDTAATQPEPEAPRDASTTVSGRSSTAISTISGSHKQSGSSTSTLPDNLPVPPLGNIAVKLDMVAKGPTQPRDCNFPRRKFSNGNLSFNPGWYDIKEAKGWLEKSDRMYCFACRLFENDIRERNEPNWISIGVSNWKKGLEKIKNHYKSTQHKCAREHFLQNDRHIDVLLDKN